VGEGIASRVNTWATRIASRARRHRPDQLSSSTLSWETTTSSQFISPAASRVASTASTSSRGIPRLQLVVDPDPRARPTEGEVAAADLPIEEAAERADEVAGEQFADPGIATVRLEQRRDDGDVDVFFVGDAGELGDPAPDVGGVVTETAPEVVHEIRVALEPFVDLG
jgi:hypothetical protein